MVACGVERVIELGNGQIPGAATEGSGPSWYGPFAPPVG